MALLELQAERDRASIVIPGGGGEAAVSIYGLRKIELAKAIVRNRCACLYRASPSARFECAFDCDVVGEAIPIARRVNVTLLSKRGEEIEGALALAPVLTDFTAHGACALFVPFASVGSNQRAA